MNAKIHLTQGQVALVDAEDYEWLMQWKWSFMHNGYAVRGKANGDYFLMHREVNKTPDGMQTDHINGNRLDNRKGNLRSTTNSQNQMNRKKSNGKTSKFKGVSWNKNANKWKARLGVRPKEIHIGYFNCEIDAANAYDNFAKKYYREYAKLNGVTA